MRTHTARPAAAFLVLLAIAGRPALAQQLPKPDPEFSGKIGPTYKDSTADFPRPVRAPRGAPNVLIILLDDVGFGMTSTFGGPVPTPTLDRLARNGLKYNRFHTTALCSPTRAALLAGRNHHTCATGVIIEMGTGFPGYTGRIPRSCALVPKILGQNGYATACFGKWHNTPETEITPAGPFDRWPTGMGFDEFYGFNQGETHQYYPALYRNITPVAAPRTPEQGYHFTEDITDQAIAWTRNVRAADPEKPWFCFFSTGAVHAPHHAPREWREKFRGQFDHGWDVQRERTFAKQKEIGVVPGSTKLTPRPKEIPAWADQPDDAKRVYCRLMENYAGFMAHTDHHIGRLIDALAAGDELDNTLVFAVVGDNGASAEGGLEGTFNELASLVGFNPGLAGISKRIDEIGGPESEPHVPVGWAWAMDAPFQWTKQVASHFGGTRNGLVVHWPRGFKARGELRPQFHHVIDVVPTILDACRIDAPKEVDGIAQKPIEGVSLRYSFNDAKARDRRTTQYFEMLGNRGVYHEGWMACTRHGVPWIPAGSGGDFADDRWELYHVDDDFSQADDLAEKNPDKVKELQAKFLDEASKYNVLPLDDRLSQRLDPRNRVTGPPRTSWTYYGNDVRLPEPAGPLVYPNSHAITAELTVAQGAPAEGVIACAGGLSGGWTLYVTGGKPAYHYNFADFERTTLVAREPLPAGKVAVVVKYVSRGNAPGSTISNGATVTLFINGRPSGEAIVPRAMFRHGVEPFEVGRDSISAVNPDYRSKGAFPFTGTVRSIRFDVTPPKE